MKIMGKLLTYILVLNFVLYPQYGQAQSTQVEALPTKMAFSLVKLLAYEMKQNPEDYFTKEELTLRSSVLDKSVTNTAIADIKKKLLDESYSFSEIKNQIHSQLIQEEQNKLIELKNILARASSEKLDEFFKTAMKDGMYSPENEMMYAAAYNQIEKIEVLMQMVHSDMGLIRSQNAKQMGLMSRADIIKQIDATGSLMSVKNDKVVTILIIVLTVAAAGLLTWGIVSATKARHERKKRELNEDFDQREIDAQNNHDGRIKTLEELFKERERLREEGYVWQVCSTTKVTKSAYCSYDYTTRYGEETCVTHCLKRADTGAEAMHQKTCLNDYIPNNCFQKNPTAAGYDDGYSRGYSTGYDTGYDRAYDEAYRSAYNSAYSSAYYRGYDTGYSSGFSAGYSDGSAKSRRSPKLTLATLLNNVEDDHAMGFNKGFQEGYAYALNLKVGNNF